MWPCSHGPAATETSYRCVLCVRAHAQTSACYHPHLTVFHLLCHLNVLPIKTWQGFECGRTADVASTTAKCDRRVVSRSNHVLHRAVRRNGVSRQHCSQTQARPATYLTPRPSAAIRVRVWGGRLSLQVRRSTHVPSGRSLLSNTTSNITWHMMAQTFLVCTCLCKQERRTFPLTKPSQ